MRLKVALLVIMMLVILLPLMGLDVTGDGTLKGKLQTFAYNALMLMSIMLCLFTIVISTYSLTNELKNKQLFLVITKPICRFQIICGKLLGVIVLDIFMLAMFAGVIYCLMMFMPYFFKANEIDKLKANNEFFSARTIREVPVDMDMIKEAVNKRYELRQKAGDLPTDMTKQQIMQEFFNQELNKDKAVLPGGRKKWVFNNVKPVNRKDEYIFIRYKYGVEVTPPDEMIMGAWAIGDDRKADEYGLQQSETPVYPVIRKDAVNKVREIPVPAGAVAADGYLALEFVNPYENGTTVMPQEVQVLYRSGTFAANYCRAALIIFARLIFLAALGVSLSTWLSFPVAVLVCMVAFVTGMMNGFIMESFDTLGAGAGFIYSLTFKPLLWLLPRFDGQYNPTNNIVGAEVIPWLLVGKTYAFMVAVKSAILTLLGIWFFSNREIAKIIV